MGNEPLLDKKVCKEYEKARASFKSNQSKKSKAKDVFEFKEDEFDDEPTKDDSESKKDDTEAKKDDTEAQKDDIEAENDDDDITEVEPDESGEIDLLEKAKELEKADKAERNVKADKIMEKLLFSKKSKDGRRASVSIAQPQISLQQMEQMAKGNFLII